MLHFKYQFLQIPYVICLLYSYEHPEAGKQELSNYVSPALRELTICHLENASEHNPSHAKQGPLTLF